MAVGNPYPSTSSSKPFGDWLGKIRKSKYKFIVIILLGCAIYTPVFFLIGDICLSGTVLSIALIFFFWLFKENNIWHQLGIGVVAFFLAALIISTLYLTTLTDEPDEALQSVPAKLSDGKVTPFRGDMNTLFTYSISVSHNSSAANISAYVIIYEDSFFNYPLLHNESMQLVSAPVPISDTWIYNYTYQTQLVGLINQYEFNVSVNGTWYGARMIKDDLSAIGWGPVSSDSSAMYSNLISTFVVFLFAYTFMPFLILVLFYRFSTRSREARTKMLDQYKQMKADKEAKIAGASGKPAAAEETFVCSECGADVQASSKFCPNCGEPFDEDESPKIDLD